MDQQDLREIINEFVSIISVEGSIELLNSLFPEELMDNLSKHPLIQENIANVVNDNA